MKANATLKRYKSNFKYFYVDSFYTYIVLFIILFFSTYSHSKQCHQIFNIKPGQVSHEVLKKRAVAIVKHQNRLRKEKGLKVFEEADYIKNLKKKPPREISSDRRYIIVKSKLVLIEMTRDFASLSLKVDDAHSLNYVYHFRGSKIIEAEPASIYYISKMPKVVELRRFLSSEEAKLWKAGKLKAIRSHERAIGWGYKEPVAHFATTSRRMQRGEAVIHFHVPRKVLLKWARKEMLTIGSEGDYKGKPHNFEIAIKNQVWEELLPYRYGL